MPIREPDPIIFRDIQVARLVQFIVTTGPTMQAWNGGRLDFLMPYVRLGIVDARSPLEIYLQSIACLSSSGTAVWRNSSCGNHTTDVLAPLRQLALILKGRFLAKEICKYCPRCKLLKQKMDGELMADIPEQQLNLCPPFTHVSHDFIRLFRTNAMGNSRTYIKLLGSVIICQNTRAVKM